MNQNLSILATIVLIAAAAAAPAARCEVEKEASPPGATGAPTHAPAGSTPAAAGSKASRLPFYEELDKIDDVNPYVIKSVIIQGNKLIPRGQIKAVIKTKAGDFYHRKDVEEDLKSIYKLGYFDGKEIHVAAETTSAGMVINIHVKENPFLKGITISGNTIVPKEKIEELFKDQLQKPRNITQLSAALKTIDKMYAKEGYLLARATTGKDEPEGTLPINVDEGKLQEIKITGLSDEQKKLVQEALTLKVDAPYNEKVLSTDLKAAIKSGKVEELQRQVDKSKTGGGYVLTISAAPKARDSSQKTASVPILDAGKSKPALPVLNRLIKSPMYKNIK
jgi:outer membrane protein insertion porin family